MSKYPLIWFRPSQLRYLPGALRKSVATFDELCQQDAVSTLEVELLPFDPTSPEVIHPE